ncbi:MAG: hypothetical protein MJZ34_03020 [Paludibacteraceae bacterium]|nr:hypothetical protein [Paludibacteraceae bacterium]
MNAQLFNFSRAVKRYFSDEINTSSIDSTKYPFPENVDIYKISTQIPQDLPLPLYCYDEDKLGFSVDDIICIYNNLPRNYLSEIHYRDPQKYWQELGRLSETIQSDKDKSDIATAILKFNDLLTNDCDKYFNTPSDSNDLEPRECLSKETIRTYNVLADKIRHNAGADNFVFTPFGMETKIGNLTIELRTYNKQASFTDMYNLYKKIDPEALIKLGKWVIMDDNGALLKKTHPEIDIKSVLNSATCDHIIIYSTGELDILYHVNGGQDECIMSVGYDINTRKFHGYNIED